MATGTASPAGTRINRDALRYARTARAAGVPPDQLENFVRAGVVLQPRQLAASAAARACDLPGGPREVGYGGARGGGKTYWMLAQMAADDAQRMPGLKGLILRKVGKAIRESIDDLRAQVLRGLPHDYRRQDGTLLFENGSRIVLGHFQSESDVDAYLGLEYDVIGIEEATTLTSSKYTAILTCCRTSKPGWRPRVYSTTNPGGVGHAWYRARFIEPARAGHTDGETRFVQATVTDNLFVDAEYRRTLEGLSGWRRRAWLDGDWDIAAGQFFTAFRRDVHVIPALQPPRHWRYWAAMDYGFNHYTAVHLFALDGDGIIYVLDEHGERGWLPQRHADAIHAMLARNGLQTSDLIRFVAGRDVFARRGIEERSGAQTIADSYMAHRIVLEPATDDRISGAAEILSRLGDPEAGIAPSLYITDRCAHLIETLPALQHDPHRPEDVLKIDCDEAGLGGDDWYDSLRYGVMAAPGRRPMLLESVPPNAGPLAFVGSNWGF